MLPFGICNALTTFQRVVLAIFTDLECVEIYMDDFSMFGDSFQEALKNLEKLLLCYQEDHLTFSDKKFRVMCKAGVVLGHLISNKGIQEDPAKIKVILSLPIPKIQREVRDFRGNVGYYRRFIENFSRIDTPLSNFWLKIVIFLFHNLPIVFWDIEGKISSGTSFERTKLVPTIPHFLWCLT